MNINKTLLILLLVQLTFQVNAQYETMNNDLSVNELGESIRLLAANAIANLNFNYQREFIRLLYFSIS